MDFVKTIKVRLTDEEESAIETVLRMLDSMWAQSEDYEMEELWEKYGSNEDGWVCIQDTLNNLLKGGK